jgi:type IX secretion system PorP/SprF family membrane protein
MLRLFHCILFVFILHGLYGQQATQYSLNAYDPLMYNPAYRTSDNTGVLNLHGRKQWTTIDGAPFTQTANLLLPIQSINTALILNIQNEIIGIQKNLSLGIGANYGYDINSTNKIVVGAQYNYVTKQLDGTLIKTPEGIYAQGSIIHNDNILPTVNVNGATSGLNMGMTWFGKTMYASLSVCNINSPIIKLNNDKLNINYLKIYYFNFGLDIKLSDIWVIKPNVFLKTDAIQTQSDINFLLEYKKIFGLGLGYRGLNQNTTDALLGLFGIKLGDKYKLYYAYDFTLSSLNTLNPGTHELLLTYNLGNVFGVGKNPPTIYNPRFIK